ncbi:hypothetical protein DPMN_151393 [Dreissena polymorpha]|uniref:Uncharacterized protein n=1 Tax=Dreissena polymorpha TaxID=45954 RepID=A0A9D4FH20_DREPO|nr:hypothetical protein DPMN_151393 [Dreissena polymorpha]
MTYTGVGQFLSINVYYDSLPVTIKSQRACLAKQELISRIAVITLLLKTSITCTYTGCKPVLHVHIGVANQYYMFI